MSKTIRQPGGKQLDRDAMEDLTEILADMAPLLTHAAKAKAPVAA